MVVAIRMPQPGQMTEECTVLQWFKREGDAVAKGDPLFEIETDKSNMEIEAFDEGTLLRIDAAEGQTVPVDAIVAWIGQPGEAIPEEGPGSLLPLCQASVSKSPASLGIDGTLPRRACRHSHRTLRGVQCRLPAGQGRAGR